MSKQHYDVSTIDPPPSEMNGEKKAEANNDKVAIHEEEAEEDGRGQWGNQIEFILACVGYAVGLGNIWRFPYLCFKNGGGAFLIPYVISLFIAGLPIFYLELILGQFSSLGPNCIFGKIAPVMKGVGWGMVVMSILVSLYYNMIIAWVLYYFVASFRKTLLWASCNAPWATENCYSELDTADCVKEYGAGSLWFSKQCWNASQVAELGINASLANSTQISPSEEFFERYVLNISEGFENMGPIQWRLALALLGAWIVIFLCLIKGVQSTGKVVYFTATFPYLVLVILLIRGATLEGASKGVAFYIKPDLSKLKDITVWKDAAVQIFYSLGPAFGSLLTMSSYNKFKNNCHRDAILVALMNCGTSFFAGFAVFSIAGFMAHSLGKEVADVVKDGTGLAFIAYPEAIVRMPVAPLWAILFFFMLFTLGLDSQFAMVETVTTAVMDQFPVLRPKKSYVIGATCIIGFFAGLPLCCRGGIYVFTLLNDYSAGFCLILLALSEVVTVMFVYGINNFLRDVQLMLGMSTSCVGKAVGPTGWYFRITWCLTAPLFLVMILVFSFVYYAPSKYGDYSFTHGAEIAGWIIACLSISMLPIFAVIQIVKTVLNKESLRSLYRPTVEWCPAHERQKKMAQAGFQKMETFRQIPSSPRSPPSSPVAVYPKLDFPAPETNKF